MHQFCLMFSSNVLLESLKFLFLFDRVDKVGGTDPGSSWSGARRNGHCLVCLVSLAGTCMYSTI